MTAAADRAATGMNNKLHGLDHLRAIAITIVFLYHYGVIFPSPAWVRTAGQFGWTGVDLFFVLSGYLIAAQLFREVSTRGSISLKTFFLKRFFRIMPGYWAVVAIYICLPFAREREAPAPLWKYLTFTQNLGLHLRTQGSFSHAWSLCIEEQFYLLLPCILLLLIFIRVFEKSGWLLFVLFGAGFAIRYYAYQHSVAPFENDDYIWAYWYKAIYYPTYCRLDAVLTGVGIAALAQFRPDIMSRITKHGNLLLLLSILILTGAFFLCADQQSFHASIFGFPLIALGYGVMVLGAVSPASFLYKKSSALTAKIAVLSYAVYLVHKIIIHLTQGGFRQLHIAPDSNLMFLLCIITSAAGALLMNRLIETPFLALRNKLLYTR